MNERTKKFFKEVFFLVSAADPDFCGNALCIQNLQKESDNTIYTNGNTVSVRKVLSDFTAFELSAGENRIEIYMIPKGFITSIIITTIGIALLAVYIKFQKKIRTPKKIMSAVEILTGFISVFGVMIVYFVPIIISL